MLAASARLGLVSLVLLIGCRGAMPESSAWAGSPPDAGRVRAAISSVDAGTLACTQDADCALTRVPEGGCCEELCEPRATSTAEVAAQASRKCPGHCPEPLCRAPRFNYSAACHAGRCERNAVPANNE